MAVLGADTLLDSVNEGDYVSLGCYIVTHIIGIIVVTVVLIASYINNFNYCRNKAEEKAKGFDDNYDVGYAEDTFSLWIILGVSIV